MATAKILQYARLAGDGTAGQIVLEPPIGREALAYTTTPATSAPFHRLTRYLWIEASAAGMYEVGDGTPVIVATSKGFRDAATAGEGGFWVGVTGGQRITLMEGDTPPA